MAAKHGLVDFEFPFSKVAVYSIVQLGAAAAAGICYSALFGNTFNLEPGAGFGWINAGIVEFLYTFMLCFVVLNVAASVKARHPDSQTQFYGLAIGFVIVAGAYGAGVVSGGCFNPAVAFGIDVASVSLGFGSCFIYMVFQLLGAAVASWLFSVVRPGDFGRDGSESKAPKLVAEFLGTYMLVVTVGLNVIGKSTAGAYSIAASLMCMIYALGDVSGAHFNPAVTLAVAAVGKHHPSLVMPYIGVQLLAGIFAAPTFSVVWAGAGFELAPNPSWVQIAVAEAIFTFVLCFVVLCVACADRSDTGHYFGLVIGSCVTVGGLAIGRISGGSLNPAVSLGVATSGWLVGYGMGRNIFQAVAYTFFELIGGLVAASFFRLTYQPVKSEVQKRKRGKGSSARSSSSFEDAAPRGSSARGKI
jgi:aquaporin Z